MQILIKSAKVIDPNSPYNGMEKDILISDGMLEKVEDRIDSSLLSEDVHILEEENLHISPGWFDSGAQFGEPGYEEAETIESGSSAAAMGGFTAVGLYSPKTEATDTRQKVEFFLAQSEDKPVHLYPIGASTVGCQGEAMAESYDMLLGGAIAFSDNKKSVTDTLIQQLIIEYNSELGAVTILCPVDKSLLHQGQMHEGKVSTSLGLHGIPEAVETVRISRDVLLAEYSRGMIHIPCISTSESVEIIRRAQKKGIDVTAAITPHHLLLDDTILSGFDTRYKVIPPLRTAEHIRALKKGIRDGVITMICSDHTPVDIEEKKCEFDKASFGTLGLQTAFGAAWHALKKEISIEKMIELMSVNPRKRFSVPVPVVREGEAAEFTVFDPSVEWVFKKEDIVSKAKNSAFINQRLTGIVIATINKGMIFYNI